jgi:hypothetical protein
MPAKPRRGEIRIDVTPSTQPPGPSGAGERPSPLPKLVGFTIWLAIALVIYGWLGTNPDTTPPPQVASTSSPAPGTGSVLPRPAFPRTSPTAGLRTSAVDDDDDRRFYAPRYIQFRVESGQQRTGSAAAAPHSIVFAYDRVRVVRVATIDAIPLEERRRAITERGAGAPSLRELKESTTHIISGAIAVTVGDLFGTDDLSVRIATNSRDIRDVSLVLSKAPRGPPARLLVPTAYALSVAQGPPPSVSPASGEIFEAGVSLVAPWPQSAGLKPLRTIYVVGEIVTFLGPSQFESSVLQAEIVDLGPRSMEAPTGQYLVDAKPEFKSIQENRTEPQKVKAAVMAAAIAAATAGARRARAPDFSPASPGWPTRDGEIRPRRVERYEPPPYRPPPPRPRPAGRP